MKIINNLNNMANTVKNTLNKVGNIIEDILGTNLSAYNSTVIGNKGGQTCLEKVGIESRAKHISRNEYRKNDIEYTRALVLAEYAIQNEYKVASTDEPVVRDRGGFETLAEQYARRDQQWKSENEAWKKQKKEDEEYLKTHSKGELKLKKLDEKYSSKEQNIKLQEKEDFQDLANYYGKRLESLEKKYKEKADNIRRKYNI
jgi:hypothetical protein